MTVHTTSTPEFLKVKQWLADARRYPPSEIFFQKYGKEAKPEERIQGICESLYKFCFSDKEPAPLNDVATAFRDAEVLLIMGIDQVKPEYVRKVYESLYTTVKVAAQALDELHKKDQLLQKYYQDWKVSAKELQSTVYDLFKPYLV